MSFMLGKETVNVLFAVRQMIKKYKKVGKAIVFCLH